MERMKIKNHLSEECEHGVISCKYMSMGCDVKLKRKYVRAHEQDDKAHLNKALDGMIKLEEKVTQLQNDNNTLTEALKNKVDKKAMIFKLTEFKKIIIINNHSILHHSILVLMDTT